MNYGCLIFGPHGVALDKLKDIMHHFPILCNVLLVIASGILEHIDVLLFGM